MTNAMKRAIYLCLVLAFSSLSNAKVTLQTIREVTNCTVECSTEIIGFGLSQLGRSAGIGQLSILELRNEDEDEMEDVITAALATLNRKISQSLNAPLDTKFKLSKPEASCSIITAEYHTFLGATTRFLNAIQERQMQNHWDGESSVFNNLAYMQALWASPKKNEQHKSFIEQQMALYDFTGCFGKTKEVLRRGVEIVEYMNDLIDTFGS